MPVTFARLALATAAAPALLGLAGWVSVLQWVGVLPEPAPPTPPGALILTGPDGGRIALYPAALLGGAR